MGLIKVGEISLYYEIHGKGPHLLLINGYGDHTGHWFRMMPVLTRNFTVIAFDNRGAGRSDKPDIPYSMKMLADDAAALVQALGINRVHVFGVSMGGMIAQELTLNYPDIVNHLVLGCTILGGSHTVYPEAEVLAFLLDEDRSRRLSPVERAREMWVYTCTEEFRRSHPEVGLEYEQISAQWPAPAHGLKHQSDAIATHDTYKRLPEIKSPTLIIAGKEDRLVPTQNSVILSERIPNARLLLLEKAGHGFFYEAAEVAGEVIKKFLLDE